MRWYYRRAGGEMLMDADIAQVCMPLPTHLDYSQSVHVLHLDKPPSPAVPRKYARLAW